MSATASRPSATAPRGRRPAGRPRRPPLPLPAGAVRASSIFPILSVTLLFFGGLCVAASELHRSRYNVILSAGIFFVSAGGCHPPPALSSAWAPGPAGATGTGGCCVGAQPGGPAERGMKQGGARGGARACARGGLWWCVQRVPCGPGRGLEGSGLLAARRLGPLRCVRRRTRAHASPSAQFLTLLMASPGAKPKPAALHALGAGP